MRQRLIDVLHASPFRPFTIKMADGQSFLVRHPDFLSRAPQGRTVVVFSDDNRMNILDLMLATQIEVLPEPPSQSPDNGSLT